MKLARGFKTYCERSVASLRAEMEVPEEEPIDMHAMATHLDIAVHSLASLLLPSYQHRGDPQVHEIHSKVGLSVHVLRPIAPHDRLQRRARAGTTSVEHSARTRARASSTPSERRRPTGARGRNKRS